MLCKCLLSFWICTPSYETAGRRICSPQPRSTSLAASKAEKIRWNFLRNQYSNRPFLVRMTAVCLVGSDAFHLNDQLEVVFKQALTATPFYIHWTDIVTVLKSAGICPVRFDEKYSGIMKAGNPVRYYWKEIPDIELKGTTNPDGNSNPDYTGKVYNFGPCRNLTCPATCISQIRQCSRCKQAQYCSADCQKVLITTGWTSDY